VEHSLLSGCFDLLSRHQQQLQRARQQYGAELHLCRVYAVPNICRAQMRTICVTAATSNAMPYWLTLDILLKFRQAEPLLSNVLTGFWLVGGRATHAHAANHYYEHALQQHSQPV
jgi:hypothetical protein